VERITVNVLLVSENKQGWWYLTGQFERRGWRCWFATDLEEIQSLLDKQSFHLILSTRPITAEHPLMALLRGSDCNLFYSYPIEDSCLWLQPMRKGQECLHTPILHPSEFMTSLDALVMRPSEPALV
jgi:hypothetical protein